MTAQGKLHRPSTGQGCRLRRASPPQDCVSVNFAWRCPRGFEPRKSKQAFWATFLTSNKAYASGDRDGIFPSESLESHESMETCLHAIDESTLKCQGSRACLRQPKLDWDTSALSSPSRICQLFPTDSFLKFSCFYCFRMERLLSRMPAEVQLMVLKEIDCPSSMQSLREASPWARSLFNEYYLEVTKAVLSHSLHPQLLQLAFAMMSKRAHGFHGMDSLRASVTSGKSSKSEPLTYPLKVGGHSLQAAISVLDTAAWVQKMAWAILRRLLDWTNHLQFFHPKDAKPFRPVHPGEAEYWRDPGNWAHQQPATAVEYEPTRCWMPSWTEAYRVHRALWRFMLYREHADVAQDGRNPFFMVRRRETVPEKACVSKFWRHLPDSEIDELHSILGAYEVETQQEDSGGSEIELDCAPPGLFSPYQPSGGTIPHRCQNTHHFDETIRITERIGPGCNFLHTMGLADSRSMLGPSDFAAFKRVGMIIWDVDRLAGLELLNDYHNKHPGWGSGQKAKKPMTRDQMLFTWKMLAFKNFYRIEDWKKSRFQPRHSLAT